MYDIKNDGKQRIKYNKPYDNPYAVLAWYIVSLPSLQAIKKVLTSDFYVKTLVIEEAKHLDICGHFLDCIDEEVIKKEHIRSKNKWLKALGEFYFSELDLPRLREEVRKYAGEMGLNLDD